MFSPWPMMPGSVESLNAGEVPYFPAMALPSASCAPATPSSSSNLGSQIRDQQSRLERILLSLVLLKRPSTFTKSTRGPSADSKILILIYFQK
jgi:hypothetical protein